MDLVGKPTYKYSNGLDMQSSRVLRLVELRTELCFLNVFDLTRVGSMGLLRFGLILLVLRIF